MFSRIGKRDNGDGGDVSGINVRDLTVAGSRIDDRVVYYLIGQGKKIKHKIVWPEKCTNQ